MSDFAIRLYVFLRAYHEDWNTHTCSPTRRELSEQLGVSLSKIDRGFSNLVKAGAVTIEQQVDASGNLQASLYTIVGEDDGPLKRPLHAKMTVGGRRKNKGRTTRKNATSIGTQTDLCTVDQNVQAPREDAPADAPYGKVETKRPRPKESPTFAQAVVIVQHVRRMNPGIDYASITEAVYLERLRLGFTHDERDNSKLCPSQVGRAIDADEHVHPWPRPVPAPRRRAPPAVDPINRKVAPAIIAEVVRSIEEWMHVRPPAIGLRTMPTAHAEPGATMDADGTLHRASPYHVVKHYDVGARYPLLRARPPTAREERDAESQERAG